MDPAQGKSMTSKLKAKVKGVKGRVHLPGHKKRHGDGGQANEGDSSGYSSDDAPKKPGAETGYNIGGSTPFTTVKATPLSPAREKPSPHEPHNRDYGAHHPPPTLEEKLQHRPGGNTTSTTEGMAKMGHDEPQPAPNKPSEGMLANLKDTVIGAAAAVGSKMGYYTEVDQTPVAPAPTDPHAPSAMDKAKASLGMDKPQDPNAPTLMEKTKATLGLGTSSPNSETSPPVQPGVVDRVSGAISSLVAGSPKESGAGEDVQHTFPAQSDYVRPAATSRR